jgi:hypothetical protein
LPAAVYRFRLLQTPEIKPVQDAEKVLFKLIIVSLRLPLKDVIFSLNNNN